jgi:hypothetical protein
MRREIEVWLRLSKHETIVPLLGIVPIVESQLPVLISQWMPSGTLYTYLKGMITASKKLELASLLFTNHIRQKLNNFMLQGQGRRRWPQVSFVDPFPIVILFLMSIQFTRRVLFTEIFIPYVCSSHGGCCTHS